MAMCGKGESVDVDKLRSTCRKASMFSLRCTKGESQGVMQTPLTRALTLREAFLALPPHTTFALRFALALPTAFVMPSVRLLASLPNEDGLYAALEKMEAAEAALLSSGNGANMSHCVTLFRDYGLQFSIEQ
jgi:hypothetical protein